MEWIQQHFGLAAISLSGISLLAGLFGNKILTALKLQLSKFMGREIMSAESIKTGDPFIDDRLLLTVLLVMEIANRKMPAAVGEDKKKFVLSYFASTSPAIKELVSAAIEGFWETMKQSIDAGVTGPQEVIIAEAIFKLKGLNGIPADSVPPPGSPKP